MRKACIGDIALNSTTKQRECRVIAWIVCLSHHTGRGFRDWRLTRYDFLRVISNLVGFAADETE
jgi:hypothetical protein